MFDVEREPFTTSRPATGETSKRMTGVLHGSTGNVAWLRRYVTHRSVTERYIFLGWLVKLGLFLVKIVKERRTGS